MAMVVQIKSHSIPHECVFAIKPQQHVTGLAVAQLLLLKKNVCNEMRLHLDVNERESVQVAGDDVAHVKMRCESGI
jgi:hypothetical protein